MDFPTSLEAATSACVVVAPILNDLLDTLIPDRALIFFYVYKIRISSQSKFHCW